MKQIFKILFISLITSLLCSCSGIAEKIRLQAISLDPLGSSGLTLHTQFDNRSHHTLHLLRAEVTLCAHEKPIARAELRGKEVIPKRSVSEQHSRWRIRLEDPTLLFRIGSLLRQSNHEEYTIAYSITIRCGVIKKTFSDEMIPLSDFLRTFRP